MVVIKVTPDGANGELRSVVRQIDTTCLLEVTAGGGKPRTVKHGLNVECGRHD